MQQFNAKGHIIITDLIIQYFVKYSIGVMALKRKNATMYLSSIEQIQHFNLHKSPHTKLNFNIIFIPLLGTMTFTRYTVNS